MLNRRGGGAVVRISQRYATPSKPSDYTRFAVLIVVNIPFLTSTQSKLVQFERDLIPFVVAVAH